MTKPKLTVKQAKFVKGIAEGKSGTQAALEAYDTVDENTAHVIASENLQKPTIQEALHAALTKQGITPEIIMQPVVDALKNDDLDMRLKGHDRAVKLIMPKGTEGGATIYNFIGIATKDKDEFGL